MTRVRRAVVMMTALAAMAAPLAVPDGLRVDASTADYERMAATDAPTLAVDIAREIAGGDLTNLTDLIITTTEAPFDAIVSAGLAGYLDTCPGDGGQRCNRTATLLTASDSLSEITAQAINTAGVPPDRITLPPV